MIEKTENEAGDGPFLSQKLDFKIASIFCHNLSRSVEEPFVIVLTL